MEQSLNIQNKNVLNDGAKKAYHSVERKITVSFSLFKLIAAQYWKSKSEMFFMFIFSIVFIAVFGYIFAASSNYSAEAFMASLSGIFLLQVIQGGMQSMPTAIMEFKTSVLLKRIGATPIKPYMFVLTAASFYFAMTILQIFWMLLWMLLFFSFQNFVTFTGASIDGYSLIFGSASTIDWGGYSFSLFYGLLLAMFIGLFIASISKSALASQSIGMAFFFTNMLFAGLLFPIETINKIDWLSKISYIAPFRYVSALSSVAWNGVGGAGSIFDPVGLNAASLGFQNYDNWLDLFMPIVWIGLLSFLAIKYFKWNVR